MRPDVHDSGETLVSTRDTARYEFPKDKTFPVEPDKPQAQAVSGSASAVSNTVIR